MTRKRELFQPKAPAASYITVYRYCSDRDLPTDVVYLRLLGQEVAKRASWAGLQPVTIKEGPFMVNAWPESVIWRAARYVPVPVADEQPPTAA